MAYKIVLTDDAPGDLEILLDYIRSDNPSAAEKFGTSLLNHVELLKNFPGQPSPATVPYLFRFASNKARMRLYSSAQLVG